MLPLVRPFAANSFAIVFATIALFAGTAPLIGKPEPNTRDRKTGMIFPNRLGSFARFGDIEYDQRGHPHAKYYAGQLIILDVYYYTDKPTFVSEYASCKDYVKIYHPEARLLADTSCQLHPKGRRAVFVFQDKFLGGRKTKLQSQLMMFPNRNYYLKIRATYPLSHADRTRREIDAFVQKLKLP